MRYASSSYGEAGQNTIAAIRDRQDFDAGNLHGKAYPSGDGYLSPDHRLPDVWRQDFLEADVIYVVRSWHTPIAWYVRDEGWVMPPVGYTAYTSRQQALVCRAFNIPRTLPKRPHITIDWDWEVAA